MKDTLVVYVDTWMTMKQREEVRAQVQKDFPDIRVAIVDGGLKVQLIQGREADQ